MSHEHWLVSFLHRLHKHRQNWVQSYSCPLNSLRLVRAQAIGGKTSSHKLKKDKPYGTRLICICSACSASVYFFVSACLMHVAMWPPSGGQFGAPQGMVPMVPWEVDSQWESMDQRGSRCGPYGVYGPCGACGASSGSSIPHTFSPSLADGNDGWSSSFFSNALSSPSMVSNMMLNMQYGQKQFADPAEPDEERRYSGTVKCFYGEKHTGHGFIFCPEIYNRTGQDVYLHARQAHRCEVGDEVSFTIVLNSRKEPQARSVVKKQEEGKFLSKKREEAERQATALQQKRARIVEPPSQAGNVMTEEQAKKFQKSLKGR